MPSFHTNGEPIKSLLRSDRVGDEVRLYLYGEITPMAGMIEDEVAAVSAENFLDALRGVTAADTIRLLINSPGGDVFDALAIYSQLLDTGARIVVEIQGVAASAATVISMVGDEVVMAENALFMVHQARGGISGTAEEITVYLDLMKKVNRQIRAIYAKRTGLSDARLDSMLATDTWLTADEALELGFVDSIKATKEPVDQDLRNLAQKVSARQQSVDAALIASAKTALAAFAEVTPGFTPNNITPKGLGTMQPATAQRQQPRDRHLAAVKDGLTLRSLGASLDPGVLDRVAPGVSSDREAQRFSSMKLKDVARECLLIDGCGRREVEAMDDTAAITDAFQGAPTASAATMTKRSLLEVTKDAIDKSLVAGYEEAPATYRAFTRVGDPASDFKDIRRVSLGAVENLPPWNDNTEPYTAAFADEVERYAVEARAESLSVSWRTFLEDNIDALSRAPRLLGQAAERTINRFVYQEFLSDRPLADGQPLFVETPQAGGPRYRSNQTSGMAQPSSAVLAAMKARMLQMRGLNSPEGDESDAILHLRPDILLVPALLEELGEKQVFSKADPDGANENVHNTHAHLQLVVEPLLDILDSSTAFYLMTGPGPRAVMELTFLSGQQQPITHDWVCSKTLSQNFTIVQTYGAKAMDYRTVQRHTGA